jgi:hypothetical protein
MLKQSVIVAGCVSVAIASVGWSLKSGIDHFVERDRVVTVKGLSERVVPADSVIWPIVFRLTGNDLVDVKKRADAQTELIRAYLISQGIREDAISLGRPSVTDTHMDFYGSNRPPERYRMECTVVVASDQVEPVLQALANQTELIGRGVVLSQSYNTQFQFTGLNAIKPAMIEEATQNARTGAQKFADDSGSRLGKIRRASQGQFSVTDRDHNTPHLKKVRIVTTVEYYLKD